MGWQDMVDRYAPLPSVLAGLVVGFLLPDRRSHELSVGWSHALRRMVRERIRYAWGICVLAHLYHEIPR